MTILEVSYPKSGTHLLLQILQALVGSEETPPFFAVFESDGVERCQLDAMDWLRRLSPNQVAASHLYAWNDVVALASKPPFVTYFIHRDLRDVCVSYVAHVTSIDPSHYHHARYASMQSFSDQLMASILDVPGSNSNIGSRFRPYLGWLECPTVLAIKFKDLTRHRHETLSRIIRHYEKRSGRKPFVDTPELLETYMRPELSGTFVAGTSGRWRECFTQAHKKAFKEVAGDLLIRLGYERNNDW